MRNITLLMTCYLLLRTDASTITSDEFSYRNLVLLKDKFTKISFSFLVLLFEFWILMYYPISAESSIATIFRFHYINKY